MPTTTGTVECVRIAENATFTTIRKAGGGTETFILWWFPGGGSGIPAELNSFTRVLHSMWVSLLREAHSNSSTVAINHPSNSAEIISVQLGVL
ncbi:MAG: hypothetical protein V3T53_09810 [Phycisphaerales bacterium]